MTRPTHDDDAGQDEAVAAPGRGGPRASGDSGAVGRRLGVGAAVVAALVVASSAVYLWPRDDQVTPVVLPTATVSTDPATGTAAPTTGTSGPDATSGPLTTPTVPAGLPLLPITRDPLVAGRELAEQAGSSEFALRECGLPRGRSGGAPYPPDALRSREWLAGASESWIYEDVVVVPDEESADHALDAVRAYYAGCFPPEDDQPEQLTRTIEVPGVGDEAFMVVVDMPDDEVPRSSTAVVVREGTTLAMYMIFAPGLGPQTYQDSNLQGLVEEFVAAASAQ